MRINYCEEDFPGQFGLWQANCTRSLKSKRGQASLLELEAALLALPTKRLIAGELDDGDDCCAVGALARFKGITPNADAEYEMEEVGVECGLPKLVAWKVVEFNDVHMDRKWNGLKSREYTPEERYDALLKWVQGLLRNPVTRHPQPVNPTPKLQ